MKSFFKVKFIAVFLCLLLVFACAGCDFGSYTDNNGTPSGSGSPGTPVDPNDPYVPDDPGKEPSDETHYIARIFVNNEFYVGENSIRVEWVSQTNKNRRFAAFLNEKGVADAGELDDDDYYVHLLNCPVEFTYNPNDEEYVASPTNRRTMFRLQSFLKPNTGTGTDWYDECYQVSVLGVYRATVSSFNQEVHYCYTPTVSGWYSITSWVDIFTDEIKPVLTKYIGNAAFVSSYGAEEIKDGGAAGSYTSNFVYNIYIEPSYVGNAFLFTVKAEQKFNTYPVFVDFEIKYEGEVQSTTEGVPIKASQANTKVETETPSLPYHYANELTGSKTFSMANIRYNPKTGCYHVYDPEVYKAKDPDNVYAVFGNGYGPRLYCDLSKTTPCFTFISVLESQTYTPPDAAGPFRWLEMSVNILNVPYDESKYDEDYNPSTLLKPEDRIFEKYLYDEAGNLTKKYKWDFTGFIDTYCKTENSDGRVYVTKELKIFLQLYAESHWFWSDNMFIKGDFVYSTPEQNDYFATQDAFWLFACGYYM